MNDEISVIVQRARDLETALIDGENELLIRRLSKALKEDIEVVTSVIDFEESCENHEAANILRPIKKKILSLLEKA